MTWVFIVECADESYYVGSTADPERLASHLERGLGPSYVRGRTRRPARIAWREEHVDPDAVRRCKKQLKSWGRERKRQLVESQGQPACSVNSHTSSSVATPAVTS